MKITIITPCFPYPNRGELTGIERVVENLAIYLNKLGHDLKIVTTYWNGGKRNDIYKGIPILRVLDSKEILGKIGSIFMLNHITFGLNALRPKNFKFYKDSNALILPLGIGFTKFFKIKKIPIISIFHHYQTPENLIDFLYLPFYHHIEKKQFITHRNIISVSNYSKNDIIKHYGIKESDILVIPNGINTSTFNPSNYSEKIRKKYGDNILFYSGLMIYRKRIPVLLEAMRYLINQMPKIHLILAGDGPMLNYLKNLAKTYGLQKNTTFLGFINENELLKYYATSDLYIFPSELEGFGQVILEAMASGTPVICVNKPPMAEIIENGGLPFKLNDPKDLSKKIIELLKNEEKLKILRNNALKIAEKYRWKKIAEKYIDYIMSIIKKNIRSLLSINK